MAKHITLTQAQTIVNNLTSKSDARFRKKTDPIDTVDLSQTLSDTISGKADQASTAAGYGITDVYTKTEVDDVIAGEITAVYKPGGSKTASELNSSLLIAANEGYVYNLTTTLTLTNETKGLFVENAENNYPVGSNIVIIEDTPSTTEKVLTSDTVAQDGVTYYDRSGGVGSYEYTEVENIEVGTTDVTSYYVDQVIPATYKFDALPGFVDLSDYAHKVNATQSTAGLMSSEDKTKLDGFTEASDAEITTIINGMYATPSVTISGESSVAVGSTITLTATTVPVGTTVTWTSSDEDVATVNNGVVEGIGVGTATITATSTSNNAVKDEKQITVIAS